MSNRIPKAGERVRVYYQFRNNLTNAGLAVSDVSFGYIPPHETDPLAGAPIALTTNPKTGATEDGWYYTDILTTEGLDGRYKYKAIATGPEKIIIDGSFSVARALF